MTDNSPQKLGEPLAKPEQWIDVIRELATMGFGSELPDEHARCQPQLPKVAMNRILVVEDDPSVQKTLKQLLEAEGFAIEGHLDGRAGLGSFHANTPG